MNQNSFLVITSIAAPNAVLKSCADGTAQNQVGYIVIGDTKSPAEFDLPGCDFWSIDRQLTMDFKLVKDLPTRHYARKNLGYLQAIKQGAEVIIETDDDNFPLEGFWHNRSRTAPAHVLENTGWTNVYRYFTDLNIWPRGFALEDLQKPVPTLTGLTEANCPIQQGLADENPDVDAIYRLILPLPFNFEKNDSVALGNGAWCPFNSQNTTWFKEAFALLYLPSYCSFRMTDIWRSYIAQRIGWTCGWNVLFHNATVYQERNEHNLMKDFEDEISGYTNNFNICKALAELDLKPGVENINQNLLTCYQALTDAKYFGDGEVALVRAWIEDIETLK